MVVIDACGSGFESKDPARKKAPSRICPWPFIDLFGVRIPQSGGLNPAQHAFNAGMKADLAIFRMVFHAQSRHGDDAPAQTVIPLDMWVIQLRHPVSPILKVDFMLPVSTSDLRDDSSFRMPHAQWPFSSDGTQKQGPSLLHGDQRNAPFVVDDVAIGVPQVLEQSWLPHI